MYRFKKDRPEEVSLWEILRTKAVASFDLNEIRSILRRVVTALDNPKSLHGILTPERIQLTVKRNHKQRIISTEYSRFETFSKGAGGHFRWYMAPEKLVGSWTTEKSHVWSLGCIVAEMFLGFPLYSADNAYEVIRNITHNCGDFPERLLNDGSITKEFYLKSKTNKWVLKTPTEFGVKTPKEVTLVSPDVLRKHQRKSGICNKTQQIDLEHFIDLLKEMMFLDPEERIPLRQVLQHPFFRRNWDLPRSSTGNVHTSTRQEMPPSSAKMEKKDLPCHSGKERTPPTVWIIGSGYYVIGAQQTANQCFGENLGLNARITWIGKVNMHWKDVLDTFNSEVSRQGRSPDILVLHVGGNDLGNRNVSDLTSEMVKDLIRIHETSPRMKIAYSSITPRLTWAKFNPMQINADRIRVNRTMKLNAEKFNGCVIEHPDLTP
ncbi:homeodomain-interacting protein kinase 2, partial [Oryzias melastigma]|uniref:homeodomain-interacting protein kinase 2 n=1 Tax=Oryzias melastigma TaxID=30732 RepID=UPI000CF7DF2E